MDQLVELLRNAIVENPPMLIRDGGVLALIAGFGKYVGQVLDSMRAGLNARDAYEHLNAMSDAQLMRRGIKREEIPAIVMHRYLSGDR